MNRFSKMIGRITGALVAVLFFLSIAVMPAEATGRFTFKTLRFRAIAGEAITTNQTVCILATDGKAYKADADASTLRPCVGVAANTAASGADVEIVAIGIMEEMTSASPGARLFLSTTAGAMTTTEPTYSQAIGWVMPPAASSSGSTKYLIYIMVPASPGAGY